MKCSFVTWQLRRLHAELDAIDRRPGNIFLPDGTMGAGASRRSGERDRTARQLLLDRLLRTLPKRLGFRDAHTFARAFARANRLDDQVRETRRRLSAAQVQELERRVLHHEPPAQIAQAIGCAEQTVLNRATQLRKRLSRLAEQDGSGV